jgi:hypothetical protein
VSKTDLSAVDIVGATYDDATTWPEGFNPAGAVKVKI